MVELERCPDCGAKTKSYHQSNGDGTTTTRVVCSKKCNGWKTIKECSHGFSKITKKWYDGTWEFPIDVVVVKRTCGICAHFPTVPVHCYINNDKQVNSGSPACNKFKINVRYDPSKE